MALAARPSPAGAPHATDVRTVCPVCGGSIHPVAGRCKHCKADLVKLRVNGATPSRLPPPGPLATAAPVPPHAAVAAATVDPGRLIAPRIRRWPLIVALIAIVAILVSVGLLVTGGTDGAARARRSTAPVLDRMDTQPLPEMRPAPLPADPWGGMPPPSTDPAPQTPPRDPDSPWPPPDTAPDPDDDPPGTGGTARRSSGPRPEEFFGSLTRTACRRLSACGLGGAPLPDLCDQIAATSLDADLADRLRSGQCQYDDKLAASCLLAVERMPCATQTMDVSQLAQQWMSIHDCGGALRCQ